MLKIDILTLFPEMTDQALGFSIPGRAQKSSLVQIKSTNLRDFGIDKHGNVDDTPYGGGPGMILRVDVAYQALEAVDPGHRALRIMLTPEGELFGQSLAQKLAAQLHLVLLCGRYEGFDSRIEKFVDQKISIGQFVLSGGELAAMVIADVVTRLIPGVLGNETSLKTETFNHNLTDFPQFTRPNEFKGLKVPEELLSGHHAKIDQWRQERQEPIS